MDFKMNDLATVANTVCQFPILLFGRDILSFKAKKYRICFKCFSEANDEVLTKKLLDRNLHDVFPEECIICLRNEKTLCLDDTPSLTASSDLDYIPKWEEMVGTTWDDTPSLTTSSDLDYIPKWEEMVGTTWDDTPSLEETY